MRQSSEIPIGQPCLSNDSGVPIEKPRGIHEDVSVAVITRSLSPIKDGYFCRYYGGKRALIPKYVRRQDLNKIGNEVLKIDPWTTSQLEEYFKKSDRTLKDQLDYWTKPREAVQQADVEKVETEVLTKSVIRTRKRKKPLLVNEKVKCTAKDMKTNEPSFDQAEEKSKKEHVKSNRSVLDVLLGHDESFNDIPLINDNAQFSPPVTRGSAPKVAEVIEQLEEVEAQVHRMQTDDYEELFPAWDNELNIFLDRSNGQAVETGSTDRKDNMQASKTRKSARSVQRKSGGSSGLILQSELYIPKNMPRNLTAKEKTNYLIKNFCRDLVLRIHIDEISVKTLYKHDVPELTLAKKVSNVKPSPRKKSPRKAKSTPSPTRKVSSKRKVVLSPARFTDSEEEQFAPKISSWNLDSDTEQKRAPRNSTESNPLNQQLRNLMHDIDELNASASPSEFPTPAKRQSKRKSRSISNLPLESLPLPDFIELNALEEENNLDSSTDVEEGSLSGSQLESIIGQVMAENEEAKSIESSQEQLDGDEAEFLSYNDACHVGVDAFSPSKLSFNQSLSNVIHNSNLMFPCSSQPTKRKPRAQKANSSRKSAKSQKATPVMKAASTLLKANAPSTQVPEQIGIQKFSADAVPVTLEFNSSRPLNYIHASLNPLASPEKQSQTTNSYGNIPQALPPKYQHKTLQNQFPGTQVMRNFEQRTQNYMTSVSPSYQMTRPQYTYSQAMPFAEPRPAHQQSSILNREPATKLIPREQPHIVKQRKPRAKKVKETAKEIPKETVTNVPVVTVSRDSQPQPQQNVPMTTYYSNFVPQQFQASQFANYPIAMNVQQIQNTNYVSNNQGDLLPNHSHFQLIQNKVGQQQQTYLNYQTQPQQFFLAQPIASPGASRTTFNSFSGNQSHFRPQFQPENQGFVVEPTPYQQTNMWPLGQPQQPQNSQSSGFSNLNDFTSNHSEQMHNQGSSNPRTSHGQSNDNLMIDFSSYFQNYN